MIKSLEQDIEVFKRNDNNPVQKNNVSFSYDKFYRQLHDYATQFDRSIPCCYKCDNEYNYPYFLDKNNKNFLPSNMIPLCQRCIKDMDQQKQSLRPYVTVVRELSFAACHRLPDYDGNCAKWHGHEWKVQIGIENRIDPKTGMVVDFKELKKIINTYVIDVLDHGNVNDFLYNPTAENLLIWIWKALMFDGDIKGISFVRIYETPNSYAELTKNQLCEIISEINIF